MLLRLGVIVAAALVVAGAWVPIALAQATPTTTTTVAPAVVPVSQPGGLAAGWEPELWCEASSARVTVCHLDGLERQVRIAVGLLAVICVVTVADFGSGILRRASRTGDLK